MGGNRFSKRPTVTVLIPTPTQANEPTSPGNRTYVDKATEKEERRRRRREERERAEDGEKKERKKIKKSSERLPYEYPVLMELPSPPPLSPNVFRRSKTSFSSPPPSPSAAGGFDYYL